MFSVHMEVFLVLLCNLKALKIIKQSVVVKLKLFFRKEYKKLTALDALLQVGMFCEWERSGADIAVRLHNLSKEEQAKLTAKIEAYNEVLARIDKLEQELLRSGENEQSATTTSIEQRVTAEG